MNARSIRCALARCLGACGVVSLLQTAVAEPLSPGAANSLNSATLPDPANAPAWFTMAYRHALSSPLPARNDAQGTPPFIAQLATFPDPAGWISNYQPAGSTVTSNNAFFQSLGTNGRTCFTCHQPANAMSISAAHAQAVFAATGGHDPLFAPVDGANCPNRVPAGDTSAALIGGSTGSTSPADSRAAHSLLLDRGLFRIFLPLPARAEYTLEVVSDPNGCNTDPAYNQQVDPRTGAVTRIVSVYRRPLMTASLKFKTTTLANFPNSGVPPVDSHTGAALPVDPSTGAYESLNIMWDGREPTLESQAINAVLIHSQAIKSPSSAQITQMVAFENGIFSAQGQLGPVNLSEGGADGGAKYLSGQSPLAALLPPDPPDYFSVWSNLSETTPTTQLQASIERGEALFDNIQFIQIPIGGGNSVTGCVVCHDQRGGGESAAPADRRNNGVGGQSVQLNGPAPDPTLPIFKLTCTQDGSVVTTNDPGVALVTGLCQDIGAFTVPPIRGLRARAPYFHDGSAATILDVVNFYDRRFTIGLTDQQKQDLVNFLSAL